MTELLIFPFNGNGLEAVDGVTGNFKFLGFIDDTEEKQKQQPYGFKVFSREAIQKFPGAKIIAVPGSPSSFMEREKIIDSLKVPDTRFTQVIHPSAKISPLAKIGFNVLIMAGVVVTANAQIGNHVCILPNSVIHHDVEIGDYTLIGSNVTIAGNTKVGNNCYLGSSSSVINGIEIGDRTLIGMGANVIKSFPSNSKLVGNPARAI